MHGPGLQRLTSRRTLLAAACGLALGCGRQEPDATPEGVIRAWLDHMHRAQGDPSAAIAAFGLLSRASKENLSERARRASAATGRTMPPEEMLVPSRFTTRFEARQMKARIAGDRAVVEVTGADPVTERATVPCVREDGLWRVDLVLPPLPAVEKRPDAG